MKNCKHMTEVYIKNWLAYCISIDVKMIYTLSLANATLSTATSHKYTHLSDVSPENTSAGSTDSRLFESSKILWRTQSGTLLPPSQRLGVCVSASACVTSVCVCFPVQQYVNGAHINTHRHANAGKHVK